MRTRRLVGAGLLLAGAVFFLVAGDVAVGPAVTMLTDPLSGVAPWPAHVTFAALVAVMAGVEVVRAVTRPRFDTQLDSTDRKMDARVEMGRDFGRLMRRRPLLRSALIVTLVLATLSLLLRR